MLAIFRDNIYALLTVLLSIIPFYSAIWIEHRHDLKYRRIIFSGYAMTYAIGIYYEARGIDKWQGIIYASLIMFLTGCAVLLLCKSTFLLVRFIDNNWENFKVGMQISALFLAALLCYLSFFEKKLIAPLSSLFLVDLLFRLMLAILILGIALTIIDALVSKIHPPKHLKR